MSDPASTAGGSRSRVPHEGMTRLRTDLRDKKINELFRDGWKPKKLAVMFGVTVWVIYQVLRRKGATKNDCK